MNYDSFSKSNPVAEAYLRMLSEEEKKRYPFKKDGDESDDDSKKPNDAEGSDDDQTDDQSDNQDDDKPVKSGDESEDDSSEAKGLSSDKDEDQDGDEDEVDDKQASANQAAVDAEGQVNPQRPEWVPDTVADADLSTFINAVAAALEQDKTQFSWGGRYFLIQRKTEADQAAELDPNLDQNDPNLDPNDSKNKQRNFGEGVEVTATVLNEANSGKVPHAVWGGKEAHALHRKAMRKFGVSTTFHKGIHDDDALSYHGHPEAVRKALVHHYGDKKVAAQYHPKLFTEAAYHPHSHVLKKIKDGEWEAQTDVKVGNHVEVIDHTDGKKKKWIHVEKDPIKENVNDVQTQKILDMHKKILKVIERPDKEKQDGTDKTPQANPVTHK